MAQTQCEGQSYVLWYFRCFFSGGTRKKIHQTSLVLQWQSPRAQGLFMVWHARIYRSV